MRKTTGILIASGLVLGLAACAAPSGPAIDGGSPVDPAACAPIWDRGGLASEVAVRGEFGVPPTQLDFPTPMVSRDATTSAVVTAGDGPIVPREAVVAGTLTVEDGTTGEFLTQTRTTQLILLGTEDTPFFDAAACAPVGSRVVAVGTVSELLGAAFAASAGLDPELTVVSSLDIDGAYLTRARGATVPPQNGLPTVSRADNGRPGLSFTNAAPPTDLRIETLIRGNGSVVADGDTVLVHYTGINWETREVFDSSWEDGMPRSFVTTGVVPGFSQALVGATVGSQVLAAIPPAEGYGDNPPQGSGIQPTDTLVFVIDVLGVLPAAES